MQRGALQPVRAVSCIVLCRSLVWRFAILWLGVLLLRKARLCSFVDELSWIGLLM